MPDTVLIADEVLADALEHPGDRRSVSDALDRPDPFADYWEKLQLDSIIP